MSCNFNSILFGCRDNAGGVAKVWITESENIVSLTKTSADTITSISGLTGTTFFEFELIRTTSQLTETVNASLENSTVFYTQELVMFFAKLEQYKRNVLKALAQNFRLAVILEDNNGQYYLLGEQYGMFVSAGSNVTGLALGDRQGYNITLQALEQLPMNQLSGSPYSVVTGMTVQ